MKISIRVLVLPFLVLFAGNSVAMTFPSVENLRFEDTTLMWDEVPDAGGYNIYYYDGGPSKFGISPEYLTTVNNTTSLSGAQPGIYRVIAFSDDAMLFSDSASAKNIWLKTDGTVDDFTGNGADVTFYGTDNERYIVETTCNNEATGLCIASCDENDNTGYITGGYCSSSALQINASGHTDHYRCFTSEVGSDIVAGAYCSN